MPVKLKSSHVQQHFGDAADCALTEDVIIERYGTPRIAMVAYRRYQELLQAEKELLKARLRAATEAAAARAGHLTNEEVEALIERPRTDAHEEQTP